MDSFTLWGRVPLTWCGLTFETPGLLGPENGKGETLAFTQLFKDLGSFLSWKRPDLN